MMDTITVSCSNKECINMGVEIDVDIQAAPWVVLCGPCRAVLHEVDETEEP